MAILALQVLSIPVLWGHQSTPADILGRYSLRYAPVLALNVLLIVACLVLVAIAPRVRGWLAALPGWVVHGTIAVGLLAVAGVGFTGVEAKLLAYLCLNWVAVVLLALHPCEQVQLHPMVERNMLPGLAGIVMLAAMPVAITGLGVNIYEPDEGHYADIATSYFADGALYNKSWLSPQYTVQPGLSWFFVAYGALLETFGYSVYISRVMSLVIYGLFFCGLAAVTGHLYGRAAALIAVGAAAMSLAFLPEWEYRPNRFILVVGIWAFYLRLRAVNASGAPRYVLHVAVGLLVTLAMNLHPISIVLALAFSLLYGTEMLWRLWRDRNLAALYPALAFGAGALTGTVIYIFANVLPAGGFAAYVGVLGESVSNPRPLLFVYTRWPSLFEQVLVLCGVGWLLWRRCAADRTVLAVLGATVLAAYVMDTQGYIYHVGAYYFVGVGALLAGLYGSDRGKTLLAGGAVVVAMGLQLVAGHTDWNTVRYVAQNGALPPYLYHELQAVLPAYVTEDDVVYSTHQLVWVFPHTGEPNVVSYAGELEGMKRFEVAERREVWEAVQPTVIIFVENQMLYDVGMQAYLADNPFERCEVLTVLNTEIEILRPVCDG